MSKTYRVVTMSRVDVCQSEGIALADLMGRAPLRELVEVLNSAWARTQGWSPIEDGRLYTRTVGDEVALAIEVEGTNARMRVTASAMVQGPVTDHEQTRLRELLSEKTIRDVANLGCEEVLKEVYKLAIPRRIEELGYSHGPITVTEDQERRIIRVEARIHVPI